MLKIEIETNGNVSNTSTIGKATVEESIFSYQAILVVAEDIKQRIIEDFMEQANVNYEKAEQAFNKILEKNELIVNSKES